MCIRDRDKSEEERQEAMAEYGLSVNIPKMKEDLRRYKICLLYTSRCV